MKPEELGNLLINLFKDRPLKDVVAYSKDDARFKELLIENLGEEKYKEIDRLDPLVWLDALRMLYLHYVNKN
ncbi:hypothetical protein [Desulfoscipio gibsoniae]|uniref:Uncharacterized protein n=1 Tax=Desulfoscipio gibsoniae DSM 7213 TaxID=767817 RepID=R4KJE1_9FIRM|nr:hypothetical protein [Desulfoscipio gibsoniae]AGL00630.1 hypothetical protein Desgi_1105 [Desulfoscipio gibsoniae DSM 7213]